ncbi:hypothetical protein F8388_027304 [Cannabis sativa]|uniref:Uncharacterized protein n=1 Tax=Cannabis sativa TaxID=3483 RepID=A0A7J6FPI8_CANSA|nr:hypothetical protein F8388_027304 [Cannabis sativa]
MALLSFQTITINTYKYNNNGGLLPSLSFSSNAISNLNKSYSHSNSCNKAYAFSINYYNNNNNNNRPFFHQPLDHHKIFSPKRTGLLLVPFNANNDSEPEGEGTGGHEEDMNAVETVLQRLYSTIKSKKVHELSDVIGHEFQSVCNFFSNSFQPFKRKKQVLDFFLRAIITLGNHIEFVVKPTLQDGMNVGIKWKLECRNISVPLGKGVSLHMYHVYHGKIVIRNLEMLVDPLLSVEPFNLRAIRYVTSIMKKLSSLLIFRDKDKPPDRNAYILLSLFIMMAIVLIFGACLTTLVDCATP